MKRLVVRRRLGAASSSTPCWSARSTCSSPATTSPAAASSAAWSPARRSRCASSPAASTRSAASLPVQPVDDPRRRRARRRGHRRRAAAPRRGRAHAAPRSPSTCPLLGTIKLTSAAAFDIGVYLVVVGLVLMVFEAFGGEPDERAGVSVVLAATAAALFSIGTYLVLQRTLTRIIIGLGAAQPRRQRPADGQRAPGHAAAHRPGRRSPTSATRCPRRWPSPPSSSRSASPPSCWPWPTAAGCSPTTTRCRTTSRTASSGATGLADEEVADEETDATTETARRDPTVNAAPRAARSCCRSSARRCRSWSGGPAPRSGSSASPCSPTVLGAVDRAARRGRPRRHRRGPGRRLAGADRHHPRGRPLLGAHARSSRSVMLLAVLVYAIGQPGAERNHVGLPVRLPRPGRRRRGVVPHRRPVQPVRRLRDDADGELRAHDARRPRRPGAHRHDLRRDQPRWPRRCSSPRSRCIYTATGTVNMADLSGEAGRPADRRCSSAFAVLLLVVFGIKAALFPLFFWLPDAYPTAPSPVTAVFAGLLTKVGRVRHHPHPDAAVPARRPTGHADPRRRRAHHGGRRPRRHRPERREAHPVVQHREPHRLHGDGPRPVHRRRPGRGASSTRSTTSWRRPRCSSPAA